MFTLAIHMGTVQTNPCQKVQSLSEDNERNRYLSEAEERRLLDVLQGRRNHLRSIVLIDLQTGLRKQELLGLRWQNVDFERDVIHVMNSRRERTKSGRSRSVPLTSIAREELLALRKESGCSEYVFVNSKTFQPLTDVKKAFKLLTKAGVGKGNGKVLQLENWTDTKIPTSNANGQHALPVNA